MSNPINTKSGVPVRFPETLLNCPEECQLIVEAVEGFVRQICGVVHTTHVWVTWDEKTSQVTFLACQSAPPYEKRSGMFQFTDRKKPAFFLRAVLPK